LISGQMKKDSGVQSAVKSFHANLPLENMHCDVIPDQPAAWTYRKHSKVIKLSNLAAKLLVQQTAIDPKLLTL
jgi:hypothetical protein